MQWCRTQLGGGRGQLEGGGKYTHVNEEKGTEGGRRGVQKETWERRPWGMTTRSSTYTTTSPPTKQPLHTHHLLGNSFIYAGERTYSTCRRGDILRSDRMSGEQLVCIHNGTHSGEGISSKWSGGHHRALTSQPHYSVFSTGLLYCRRGDISRSHRMSSDTNWDREMEKKLVPGEI